MDSKMKYKCMSCGRIFYSKSLPTIDNGDGCCCIGSLIEHKDDIKQLKSRLQKLYINEIRNDGLIYRLYFTKKQIDRILKLINEDYRT